MKCFLKKTKQFHSHPHRWEWQQGLKQQIYKPSDCREWTQSTGQSARTQPDFPQCRKQLLQKVLTFIILGKAALYHETVQTSIWALQSCLVIRKFCFLIYCSPQACFGHFIVRWYIVKIIVNAGTQSQSKEQSTDYRLFFYNLAKKLHQQLPKNYIRIITDQVLRNLSNILPHTPTLHELGQHIHWSII